MIISNVYEAKAKLSNLINQALSGKQVFISKSGEPKIQLVPIDTSISERQPGLWKGKVKIHEDFDKLPNEVLNFFSGK